MIHNIPLTDKKKQTKVGKYGQCVVSTFSSSEIIRINPVHRNKDRKLGTILVTAFLDQHQTNINQSTGPLQ